MQLLKNLGRAFTLDKKHSSPVPKWQLYSNTIAINAVVPLMLSQLRFGILLIIIYFYYTAPWLGRKFIQPHIRSDFWANQLAWQYAFAVLISLGILLIVAVSFSHQADLYRTFHQYDPSLSKEDFYNTLVIMRVIGTAAAIATLVYATYRVRRSLDAIYKN